MKFSSVFSRLDPQGLGRKVKQKGVIKPLVLRREAFLMQKMKIIESINEMQAYSESNRLLGKKIAFVPTMGYFHEGHLALIKEAKKMADCVVVSIYVNPTQFGPKEDFSKYPRDFDRDSKMAESIQADVIFYPPDKEMYPTNYQTYVNLSLIHI